MIARTTALCILALVCGALQAQGTATANQYVLRHNTVAGGTTMGSSTYQMRGELGSGPAGPRSTSATFQLESGFPATLTDTGISRPWLTAARPLQTEMNLPGTLTLHGTGLDLGTQPMVTIGGQTATIRTRSTARLTVDVPALDEPGWQPVTYRTSAGVSTIPRGLAVLPLIETRPAAAANVAFRLAFRGNQGDQVMWVLGIAPGPLLPLPGIRYGLGILPPTLIVFTGFSILNQNGELELAFPPTSYSTGTLYLQGLFSGNRGAYAPAAFSNVLRI